MNIYRTGKSSPFFCAENLTCWRTGGKSGKRKIWIYAENLTRKTSFKHLENPEHGKAGRSDGKSGKSGKLAASGKSGLTGKSGGKSGKSGKSNSGKLDDITWKI